MAVLATLFSVLLIICAIVLIASVLMQEGSRAGLGAISGGAETFLGKAKGRSMEGKLLLITKITTGAFIVLAVLATIVNR